MLREERRLEALVDSLLRSTQLDAGGMAVDRTEVAWAERVEEQVELIRRQDPARSIELDVEPGAGAVSADEALAVGVLTNLLSNALKYAEGGGPIEVVVEADGDEVVDRKS